MMKRSFRAQRFPRMETLWPFADQGVVSLGNFVTNWLMAKYLAPAEYGIFGLLFGVLLFANSLHSSLITTPLGVAGATGDVAQRKILSGYALLFSAVMVAPLTLVCWIACAVLGHQRLIPWIILAMALWFA